MEEQAETVYVVDEWYDGPRTGFANYQGMPHFYRSLYLDWENHATFDRDEDRFELTPVSLQAVTWAMEDDQLWQRWDEARRVRPLEADDEDKRRLPQDRARHHELRHLIEQHLRQQNGQAFLRRGYFAPGCKTVQWKELI